MSYSSTHVSLTPGTSHPCYLAVLLPVTKINIWVVPAGLFFFFFLGQGPTLNSVYWPWELDPLRINHRSSWLLNPQFLKLELGVVLKCMILKHYCGPPFLNIYNSALGYRMRHTYIYINNFTLFLWTVAVFLVCLNIYIQHFIMLCQTHVLHLYFALFKYFWFMMLSYKFFFPKDQIGCVLISCRLIITCRHQTWAIILWRVVLWEKNISKLSINII